jgi:Fe-S-cluster containining protein
MESKTDMEAKRTHCVRCGECCLAAGPSLQKSDLPLFFNHVVGGSHLYTVRKGELVRDNINDELKFTDQEILKFRERKTGGGCILYDENEKACSIYTDRPSQCRAFGCWDDSEFNTVFSGPKARRADIIKDANLLRLIAAHDEKCSYQTISRHVEQIPDQGEAAVRKILKILQYDQEIRLLTHEKLAIDSAEMDLLYGRPLTETIHMFGLKVRPEEDGSFLLIVENH